MEKIIFTKYSNERAKQFAIRTDILESEAGKRKVRKQACFAEGKNHIKNIASWY